jgi:hypothetical protein
LKNNRIFCPTNQQDDFAEEFFSGADEFEQAFLNGWREKVRKSFELVRNRDIASSE